VFDSPFCLLVPSFAQVKALAEHLPGHETFFRYYRKIIDAAGSYLYQAKTCGVRFRISI
jgi:hypothetical protein